MKRFLLTISFALASVSLLAGCQTMSHTEDARINAAIKGKLAEEQFDLSRVGVDTGNAHVYLSGVVASSDHKARVEQIANGQLAASPAASYGTVINRLQVWPVISDATVTSSVKGLLMTDRMINASQIGVETQQGIVILNGIVPSPEQRLRAELLARDVHGVRQVVNNLQVTTLPPSPPLPPSSSVSPPLPNDPMITATVKDRLTMDRTANLARVRVDTTEGTVYLNGVVPSPDHKTRAEQIARDVRGVNQVVNNLQVQP
jgi:hyperosmotically inducible protein